MISSNIYPSVGLDNISIGQAILFWDKSIEIGSVATVMPIKIRIILNIYFKFITKYIM